MVALISLYSFWEWTDIIGLLIVTVGCGGELWLHFKSAPYNPTDFHFLESGRRGWETLFLVLVVLGLALEFVALPISLTQSHREVGALQNETQRMKKQTEELRRGNLELEAKIQPRAITPEQTANVIRLLGTNQDDTEITVFLDRIDDPERALFGKQVNDVLSSAGFKTSFRGWEGLALGGPVTIFFGLTIQVNPTNQPVSAKRILDAFNQSGVEMLGAYNPGLPSNSAQVVIGYKRYFVQPSKKQ